MIGPAWDHQTAKRLEDKGGLCIPRSMSVVTYDYTFIDSVINVCYRAHLNCAAGRFTPTLGQ